MLKSWSIENFKPIVNSGELKLAPVTVLAGRNSSGKSSLLQSILMIAQTLSNQLLERALLPNERIVQLGTFEDILSEFSSSRSMTFKFELSFGRDEVRQNFINLQKSSDHVVTVTFTSGSGNDASSSAIEASKVVVEDVLLNFNFEFDIPNVVQNSPVPGIVDGHQTVLFVINSFIKKMSVDEIRNFLKIIDPDYLSLLPYSGNQANYLGQIKASTQNTPDQYLVALSHFLPVRPVHISKNETENLEGPIDDIYISFLERGVEQITRFFTSKIRYLGPLRTEPSTIQRSFAPTSELDEVGAKGEYSAVVYQANQNASIKWYNPQTKQVERATLQEALDSWAQYLGIASQVRTDMAGAIGVTWKVVLKEGQKPRTLPEVGVGVSQVLPILVMGLLSPQDTLLILEQPELHLHASVQARLGDFFVGLAKCKKQCLIETHSENLVSQLRYHIVQSGGQDKSDCMIYFVDQDEQGAAKFEPVKISPQGNILNWPDGFFDETMLQEDRITAASIKKRANKVKNG